MILGRCAALLALSVASGCAAAPESTVVDASLPEPDRAASSRPLPVASAAAPARDPFTVEIPDSVACVLTATDHRRVPLRLTPTSEPFGVVQRSNTLRAHLARGPASRGIVVDVDAKGVRLRGFASAEDFPLHANRVSVFGGIVMPTHKAELRLVEARVDGLDLRLDLPSIVELPKTRSLLGPLPCEVVSIGEETFDPHENYFGPPTGFARLRGDRIPLSRGPQDKADVTLLPGTDTRRDVAIIGRESQRYRIVWEVADLMVFGWVDAARLDLGTPKPERSESIKLGNISTRGGCCRHIFVCPDEVPLRASKDEHMGTVGMIAAGTRIRVYYTLDEVFGVDLSDTNFDAVGGAKLLVDKASVAGCRDLEKR